MEASSQSSRLWDGKLIAAALFFGLALMVCILLLFFAHRFRIQGQELSQAAVQAQQAAEYVRAQEGGFSLPGAVTEGEDQVLWLDRAWQSCDPSQAVYLLRMSPSQAGDLLTVQISVERAGVEEPLYTLEALRYL